jgi:hypothetical protein
VYGGDVSVVCVACTRLGLKKKETVETGGCSKDLCDNSFNENKTAISEPLKLSLPAATRHTVPPVWISSHVAGFCAVDSAQSFSAGPRVGATHTRRKAQGHAGSKGSRGMGPLSRAPVFN